MRPPLAATRPAGSTQGSDRDPDTAAARDDLRKTSGGRNEMTLDRSMPWEIIGAGPPERLPLINLIASAAVSNRTKPSSEPIASSISAIVAMLVGLRDEPSMKTTR